jgi:phosphohistidine swiveling domain-containing protein
VPPVSKTPVSTAALLHENLSYNGRYKRATATVEMHPGMDLGYLLPNLRKLAEKLESHFQDMCDFEFTVQEGKLYVLGARIGKRTPQAGLRIATDLFLERKITGKELVSRIEPDQVKAVLKPTIVPNPGLHELGRGLPASSGAATGIAAFSAEESIRVRAAGGAPIFVCEEVVPDDIHGLEASAAVVSFLGGMTSHAAVYSRGMGKPCVAGLHWRFEPNNVALAPRGGIREGNPLTVDGTAGVVYAGKAEIESPKALQNERLLLLLRVIDVLSAQNELPPDRIGTAWHLRDIMIHGPSGWDGPDPDNPLLQWPRGVRHHSKAFDPLDSPRVRELCKELLAFRLHGDRRDDIEIWCGLRSYLLRLLSKNVGLGRHPEFWRPLFDPCQAVVDAMNSGLWNCKDGQRAQLVGEEFFSINYYVPELIDIGTVRLYCAIECEKPGELWRIDRTNPAGEKLLRGSTNLGALKVVVNDATVPSETLRAFYNALRRREYYWDWYGATRVSRLEIIDGLKRPRDVMPLRVRQLAERAGLVSTQGTITNVGRSLLRPSTASERAHSSVRIGW